MNIYGKEKKLKGLSGKIRYQEDKVRYVSNARKKDKLKIAKALRTLEEMQIKRKRIKDEIKHQRESRRKKK